MTDHADVPPNRRLPQAVRDTARLRIEAGIHQSSPRRRMLAPASIAAAVLLIAGGGLTVKYRQPAPSAGPAPIPATPSPRVSAGTVWAMTEQERYKITESVPQPLTDRCERLRPEALPNGWRPLYKVSRRGVDVVVYQAGSTTIFCELTAAGVAVSAPAPASPKGSGRAGFVSQFGTVAGVVDPRVHNVKIKYTGDRADGEPYGESAIVRSGTFVLPNGIAAAPTSLVLSMNGILGFAPISVHVTAKDMPAPVTPVIDQPQPPIDHGTAASRRLTDCFDRAYGPPVVDPESWTAGAEVQLDADESARLGHYQGLLVVCLYTTAALRLRVDDGTFSNGPGSRDVPENPFFRTSTMFYDFHGSSNTVAVTGLAKDPRVASVSITRPSGTSLSGTVQGGTFAIPGIDLGEGTKEQRLSTTITAHDATGGVLATFPMTFGATP